MHDEKRTINVNLAGATIGSYPLSAGGGINKYSYGSYSPDYIGELLNRFLFTSGRFELTEVDTLQKKVNARFYGTVKNKKGDSLKITEGKIMNGF